MADKTANLSSLSQRSARHRGLLLPLAACGLIFVILVPLQAGMMDVLLAGNLALSALILVTAIMVATPMEFSVLPSILLGATLLRLVLNIATTRLILTAGAEGRNLSEAQLAAGQVVWTFSQFVTSSSLAVGVILFCIFIVIQYLVITKGAARISEVAARFVLDAMPGRQMAIDADLNAGMIDNREAMRRRESVTQQADFYGAMDGASKFLRGDALAAMIILVVNILGGLYVGMVQYGWSLSQTSSLYTRLTIGDGLVMQVPAFIVSVAAALIVTRSNTRTNLGEEVIHQLSARPVVLGITAIFLAALSLTSLPKLPLLLLGSGFAGAAWLLRGRQVRQKQLASPQPAVKEQKVEDLLAVDAIQIELGYALVRMADSQREGDLLERIAALRGQIAAELGLLVPQVKIKDNMQIATHSYVIKIRGAKVASGQVFPRMLMALGGDDSPAGLEGRQAIEPAFGTPAVWIYRSDRQQAERLNYTVIEASAVLVTHLGEVIRNNAAELLTRQQVSVLLENLKLVCPQVVQEASTKLSLARIQKVLQNLLREKVPVRDLEAILETLTEAAESTDDVQMQTELVRSALSRTLTQQYCSGDGKLWCISLDSESEQQLGAYLSVSDETGDDEPTRQLTQAMADSLLRLRRQGRKPILLCSPQVRRTVRKLIAPLVPEAAVLAYNEIDAAEIHSLGSVRINQ